MYETRLECPDAECGAPIYRRAMSIAQNRVRRQVDRRYDQYICLRCRNTYTVDDFDEPELDGKAVDDGW